MGCSPWGHEESDMTERLHFHFSLSCIGEGNGNPLQCSCLENPRDGGAWWAAVSGVTQSWTRLKRLSSSSSLTFITPVFHCFPTTPRCNHLLLLLLSRFSRVQLCVTPWTAAHQSLGFSRQEHWSGVPLPSPMNESESEVAQSCPTLHDPMDCSPPGSSIHWIFQARILEWGAIAFSEMTTSRRR